MIVDFAIENDSEVAIFGGERLVARLEINNFQARCSQRHGMRFEDTLLIRSAMDQRFRGISNATGIRNPVFVCKADNSAQLAASRSPRQLEVVASPLTIGIQLEQVLTS